MVHALYHYENNDISLSIYVILHSSELCNDVFYVLKFGRNDHYQWFKTIDSSFRIITTMILKADSSVFMYWNCNDPYWWIYCLISLVMIISLKCQNIKKHQCNFTLPYLWSLLHVYAMRNTWIKCVKPFQCWAVCGQLST